MRLSVIQFPDDGPPKQVEIEVDAVAQVSLETKPDGTVTTSTEVTFTDQSGNSVTLPIGGAAQ